MAVPKARGWEILDVAIQEHSPVAVFGLFSGGHDSLCATHIASHHPAFTAAVHINTGIGIERTREFVRETCESQGWPLLEYRAEDQGQRYEDLVLAHGFPGPFHHRKMYNRLKERCLRALTREHKTAWKDRIICVTGVRRLESTRRMGTVQAISREGARVWVAPIIEWTNEDKHRYMEAHGLPPNPVVEKLCMSGECLCGAFAKPGELDEIRFWFPDTAARIDDLQERAKAAGVPYRWGTRPPKQPDPMQQELPLCFSCEARQ